MPAPHILDQNVPTVEPAGAPPGDYENIHATPEMFGGLVAQGEERLGKGVEQAGQDATEALIQRQTLQNDVHTTEVNSWYAQQVTDKFSKFQQLQGKSALDALPQFKADLAQLQKDAISQAPSLQEQAKLGQSVRYLTDSYYRYATNHADQQLQTYARTTAGDAVANYANLASLAYMNGDMQGFQRNLNNQDMEVRNFSEHQGITDPAAIEAEVTKRRGATLRTLIETEADRDPNAASMLYSQYAQRMDPGSRLAVENKLRPILQQQNFRIGADLAIGKQPDAGPFQGAEKSSGLPNGYVSRTIHLESGGDPNARTGSYSGLGQFGPKEQQRYGITDPGSVTQTANALLTEAEENRPRLYSVLGRNPTAAELYLAHQQGGAGAAALLNPANATKPAWQAIRQFYGSDDIAKKAIWGNMTPQMKANYDGVDQVPAAGFAMMWSAKYNMGPSEGAVIINKSESYRRAEELFGNDPRMLAGVKAQIARDVSSQNVEFAERRAEIGLEVPTTIEAVRSGDVTRALPSDIDLLGDLQSARAKAEYQSALLEGRARIAMQFQSPDEVAETRNSLVSGPGREEFRVRDLNAFDNAVKQRDALVKKDPALYTSANDNVAAKLRALNPKDPQSFADYAAATLALQEHMGVPANAQHILSQPMAQRLTQAIVNAPDPKLAIDSLQYQWGARWPQAFNDLVTQGKIPPAYEGIALLNSDAQGHDDAALLSRWLRETSNDPEKKGATRNPSEILGAQTKTQIDYIVRMDPGIQAMQQKLIASGRTAIDADNLMHSVEQLAYAKQFYHNDVGAALSAITAFTSREQFLTQGKGEQVVNTLDDLKELYARGGISKDAADQMALQHGWGIRTPPQPTVAPPISLQ